MTMKQIFLTAALLAASPALAQSDRSYGWIIERPVPVREINRPMPGPHLTLKMILAAAKVASQIPRPSAEPTFSWNATTVTRSYPSYGGGYGGGVNLRAPQNWWMTDIGRGARRMGR
jgi:hypothetical protein